MSDKYNIDSPPPYTSINQIQSRPLPPPPSPVRSLASMSSHYQDTDHAYEDLRPLQNNRSQPYSRPKYTEYVMSDSIYSEPNFGLAKPILSKPIHSCLFFGETGCGKSTCVNMLTNYFRGGNIDNIHLSIPTCFLKQTETCKNTEKNVINRTIAQTTVATEYPFETEDFIFKIIDTPGLNDTSGHDQDEENIQNILSAAINAKHLSAIILVINGTQARITNNVKAVLAKFRGSLPDSILSNIIVICTMCREESCNLNIEPLQIKPVKIMYMNNTAFSVEKNNWTHPKMIQFEWDMSMDVCRDLVQIVATMSGVSTNEFVLIKQIRNKIKADLHNIKNNIIQLQQTQEEFEAIKAIIASNNNDVTMFNTLIQQKQIEYNRLVNTNGRHTTCGKCNRTCHENCNLETIAEKGSQKFVNCWAFGSGNTCNQCTCHYSHHYHSSYKVEQFSTNLQQELTDLQQKYQDKNNQLQIDQDKSNKMLHIQKNIDNAIDQMEKNTINNCKVLKKICSGFNFVNELHIMIEQLEQYGETLTTVGARQTSNRIIISLRDLCDRLSSNKELDEDEDEDEKIDVNKTMKDLETFSLSIAHKSTDHVNTNIYQHQTHKKTGFFGGLKKVFGMKSKSASIEDKKSNGHEKSHEHTRAKNTNFKSYNSSFLYSNI